MEENTAPFIAQRNNVTILGQGSQVMVFAHGFGCDQNMWRYVIPAFLEGYKVVLFDHVGAGHSDLSQFDPVKYGTLHGYAKDVLDICRLAGGRDIIFVGHSVSALIGILAAIEAPEMFSRLILVGPSPCYINDGDYIGGFERANIEELLEFMDGNYLGWSSAMAPAIMGNPDRPSLASELENSFCRTDPEIAKHFARTTFLSDHRADLDKLTVPSLILQCSADVIAPQAVGEYLHRQLANSTLVLMKATGHCPNLSAPDETIESIARYLPPSTTGRGHHQQAA
ncbi:sigma-B regulation protein RsbQ [Noviherbaspirillum humi]|uniref:Sigma-B regulation protein RsbQ n=1 Tax=Noviherbaspirillum humi TaxID=1688639 RepID=A0A239M5G8_9BURK|nr:alpha/beta hydrolase [Noviherbaspirillum humi]SNT37388.1 sigma-B regulation protein RsbQ [Noviherbaspirillum humi]